MGVGLLSQVTRDKTRGNGLELYEGSLNWMLGKISSLKCGQALDQAAQESGGKSVPGTVQNHVDVQHGLVMDLAMLG